MKQKLAGVWQFALDKEKVGIAQEFYKRGEFTDTIDLPTTTAEAGKGERSGEKRIDGLTEVYHFEGYAWYQKKLRIPREEAGKRFFFVMERTRNSIVWVDGHQAGHFESFYAEHRYELTQWLTPGIHTLTVMIDNTDYAASGGHMTSPDTQTNWNGIVGEIYLESTGEAAIDRLRLYPSRRDKSVQLYMDISGLGGMSMRFLFITESRWKRAGERPMILEDMAATRQLKPIVRMMDNFERNHNLGLIYEGKFHEGRLLACHADLLTLKERYPEAACLYGSLVSYVASEAFRPRNSLS